MPLAVKTREASATDSDASSGAVAVTHGSPPLDQHVRCHSDLKAGPEGPPLHLVGADLRVAGRVGTFTSAAESFPPRFRPQAPRFDKRGTLRRSPQNLLAVLLQAMGRASVRWMRCARTLGVSGPVPRAAPARGVRIASRDEKGLHSAGSEAPNIMGPHDFSGAAKSASLTAKSRGSPVSAVPA
jgi:hypothetical protein